MPGSFGAESLRFRTIDIENNFHAGYLRSSPYETRIVPIQARPLRLKEDYGSIQTALGLRHHPRELAQTRLCARADRMRQHHQGVPIWGPRDSRIRRPAFRNAANATRRMFIAQQCSPSSG